MRDMISTAEAVRGEIPDRYDLTVPEINTLHSMIHTDLDGELDALTIAFKYGFVLGARAQKAGKFQAK